MKKLWLGLGLILSTCDSVAMDFPLRHEIQDQNIRFKIQKNFSYLAYAQSVFDFKNEDDARSYYEWFITFMIGCFASTDNSQSLKLSTQKLECHVINKIIENHILIGLQDFQIKAQDGTRVVHPQAAALTSILRNIASQIVATKEKLEKEIDVKNEQEKNQIMAQKMYDLFKPLEEHIVARHEATKPKPHWSSGWKGHLLAATVGSAFTLGAVYGVLKMANVKLTHAGA